MKLLYLLVAWTLILICGVTPLLGLALTGSFLLIPRREPGPHAPPGDPSRRRIKWTEFLIPGLLDLRRGRLALGSLLCLLILIPAIWLLLDQPATFINGFGLTAPNVFYPMPPRAPDASPAWVLEWHHLPHSEPIWYAAIVSLAAGVALHLYRLRAAART